MSLQQNTILDQKDAKGGSRRVNDIQCHYIWEATVSITSNRMSA